MAIALRGLNVRRQYGDLIGVAFSDGLEHIKCPNRNASFLRWVCNVTIGWGRNEDDGKTTRNGKQRIRERTYFKTDCYKHWG